MKDRAMQVLRKTLINTIQTDFRSALKSTGRTYGGGRRTTGAFARDLSPALDGEMLNVVVLEDSPISDLTLDRAGLEWTNRFDHFKLLS
ncbi:unnamed protein product [Microthlaspi erraticum]|uniref:Uncharacterized protein n=1 Tax=Microthlaspi erraticum TaxID=1685480 RepID=A0A6D2I4A9_9BRAS|nr:unnamed protein product [Microthlaspi erraticum]